MIEILKSGILLTVQSNERALTHLGFSPSGVMDTYAYTAIKELLGQNHQVVLESLGGDVRIQFNADYLIALAGPQTKCYLNDVQIVMWSSIRVTKGDILTIDPLTVGLYFYIGIKGAWQVQNLGDSVSTDLKGQVGGFNGKGLKASDRINICHYGDFALKVVEPHSSYVDSVNQEELTLVKTFRFIPDTYFLESEIENFCQNEYVITRQSNRMGIRLDGNPLETKASKDIVSKGVCFGAIQMTNEGLPIVLASERQATGGYALMGTLLAVELPKFVQCQPGQKIRFVPIEWEADLVVQKELFFNMQLQKKQTAVIAQSSAYCVKIGPEVFNLKVDFLDTL